MSVNPLAALHPNQYRAMYLLALEKLQGTPQALLEVVMEDAAGRGQIVRDAASTVIDEVWQNHRAPGYYEQLWKLAKRREQGIDIEAALDHFKGEREYPKWRAMIRLVWGQE